MISFFGLNKSYINNREKIISIIDKTLSEEEFLRGKSVGYLEEKCARILGRKYAIAVNSGTDALALALRGGGIIEGDEVIVTAFSFVASASPILMVGATPVFVDINPDTYLMDLNKLKAAITKRTKAIIAVQLYGQCVDPLEIEKIAKEYELLLIEDAAQAFGSQRNGRSAGTIGDVSTISFDVSKVVNGISTGGIILTDNCDLYKTIKSMRSHGLNVETKDFEFLGFNSQMSSINAAVLSYKIDIEGVRRERRIEIAERYIKKLSNVSGIKCPILIDDSVHNFHKFVIRVDERDELIKFLSKSQIETKIHYNKPIPHNMLMSSKSNVYIGIPETIKACSEVLSLPIYAELENDEVDYISNQIIKFYNEKR